MDLKEIRYKIDQIDNQIFSLIHRRMEYALQAGKQKQSVNDPSREERIMKSLTGRASVLMDKEYIKELFGGLMERSKKLQEQKPTLVAFQGEHGAWSEIAIHNLSFNMVPIPCLEFADVFASVANGEVDYGMVPIENSIEGSVHEVNDLLVETSLKIVAETTVPVHHNLLVIPGSDYREIKSVYSHPQALAQCRSFLTRNKLEPRPFYDTAGAARWLAHERQSSSGVIASSLAAELHGLEIIKDHIEDHPDNSTRFILLSREEAMGEADKCTIAFSTQHRVGALFDILGIFAKQKINLTRIESRPVRKNPGAFAFLLDFQGDRKDPAVKTALSEITTHTMMFKSLGFYKEARL
jgi:prephenate dehydratase/chorismate mutase